MFENLNSQDIMAKINDRAKNKLVFKGLINLIGGNDTGSMIQISNFYIKKNKILKNRKNVHFAVRKNKIRGGHGIFSQ